MSSATGSRLLKTWATSSWMSHAGVMPRRRSYSSCSAPRMPGTEPLGCTRGLGSCTEASCQTSSAKSWHMLIAVLLPQPLGPSITNCKAGWAVPKSVSMRKPLRHKV